MTSIDQHRRAWLRVGLWSGFLEGWGTTTSASHARPEFDMVTGVSTGALIAPCLHDEHLEGDWLSSD